MGLENVSLNESESSLLPGKLIKAAENLFLCDSYPEWKQSCIVLVT